MGVWRAIQSMALMACVVGAPGYVEASEGTGVGVVTTLIGEATVVRTAAVQPRNLQMRDRVLPLDRITTKERSMVHVLMGGKALLTVKELSVVTVTEDGGRATVDLQSGKVGLAVVHEKMKPGDVIEVKTPQAVAAVRGTVLVVEIIPGTGEANQSSRGEDVTNVHLIHGKLDVSLRSNPGGAPVRLESLQTVSVTRDVLGTMRPLDLPTATALSTGLKPAEQAVTAIPEKLQAAVAQRQGALALATAAEVARNGLTRGGSGAKANAPALAKAGESSSSQDALAPVVEVSDGAATLVGSGAGSLDAGVGSLGGGIATLGSGGGAVGSVVGIVVGAGRSSFGSGGGSLLGNSGPGSIGSGGGSLLGNSGPGSIGGGGGKGPGLSSGSGSGPVGNLAPVIGLSIPKKK